jgi:hypothetical protein
VQLAHELGVRPQIIYGYIKHGRVKTYPNDAGKAALVDANEVEAVLKSVRHRDPNAEKSPSGRTVHRSPVKRGDILSWDKKPDGRTGRRVANVSRVIKDDEGSDSIVYLHDGTREIVWQTATLSERLRKGYTTLENVPALLGMIIFQLKGGDEAQQAEAALIEGFLQGNDIHYTHFVVEHEPEE